VAAVLGTLRGSLANVAPIAIVVPDADLADELSMRTLAGLVASADELPVLLVVAYGAGVTAPVLDALASVPPERIATAIGLPRPGGG
jgi:hypothetical protein